MRRRRSVAGTGAVVLSVVAIAALCWPEDVDRSDESNADRTVGPSGDGGGDGDAAADHRPTALVVWGGQRFLVSATASRSQRLLVVDAGGNERLLWQGEGIHGLAVDETGVAFTTYDTELRGGDLRFLPHDAGAAPLLLDAVALSPVALGAGQVSWVTERGIECCDLTGGGRSVVATPTGPPAVLVRSESMLWWLLPTEERRGGRQVYALHRSAPGSGGVEEVVRLEPRHAALVAERSTVIVSDRTRDGRHVLLRFAEDGTEPRLLAERPRPIAAPTLAGPRVLFLEATGLHGEWASVMAVPGHGGEAAVVAASPDATTAFLVADGDWVYFATPFGLGQATFPPPR